MIAKDYIQRRTSLYSLLPKDSIVIVHARDLLHRSLSIPYNFNQFSDFLYLTGNTRPSGALAMYTLNGSLHSALFLPQPDPEAELMEGFRTTFEEGQKISGVDSVRPLSEFPHWISQHCSNSSQKNIFASLPPHQSSSHSFRLLAPYLDQLKVVKSAKEIKLMKRASEITKKALNKVLAGVKPGIIERQVAARFENECINLGATGLAYPAECQAGENALCLHYIENSCQIKEGDCLLLDAGCEYDGYASDFTRTIPVGRVSSAKLAALKIVEKCKNDLVASAKSGKLHTLNEINEKAKDILVAGLKELGVKSVDKNTISEYFPHHVSHWIGLDVHDSRTVDRNFKIKKGCCFTVEPGLYFAKDSDCPAELKGLGVRFEDTVIIE
ncbi:putative Xaa-Pro aminopeptidase 3 [Tritrichomonas foetus]|uniref:Xaa-Pro aminopeptidase 3 n=1 Tax=Tritrichomonas foetus TaxID=1144522 RepID=A0A1J4KZV6_9EUKA|nr:putative Xaa-Pro aminopeptidase 3 [Tritrichomonas foetus]|eukprot:OHT16400.1 putative Xaa-Pro aminopeptidase 3 [Tritrichomonas foetus]